MTTMSKTGRALTVAALLMASPAWAGHESFTIGPACPPETPPAYGQGHAPGGASGSGAYQPVSQALQQEAELVFADFERTTADLVGGSAQGAGTYDLTWVDAYGDEYIQDTFVPGKAVVVLLGDGSADLDLHIYDGQGRELCSSTSMGAGEMCEIDLLHQQDLEIHIDNQTMDSESQFLVWTN